MATDQGVHAATRALRALLRHADAAEVTVQSVVLRDGALTVLVGSYWDFALLHERLGGARRYFRPTEDFWMVQEPVRVCSSYRHTSGAAVTIQGPLPQPASAPGVRRSEAHQAPTALLDPLPHVKSHPLTPVSSPGRSDAHEGGPRPPHPTTMQVSACSPQ